jgi:hypothetical protein
MTTQNYLIIENNVVTNEVVWDGNTQTWTPPINSIQLIRSITPAMVWEMVIVDRKITDYVLVEELGVSSIGFTWDGTVLTTNEPKPTIPSYTQPITQGTQPA